MDLAAVAAGGRRVVVAVSPKRGEVGIVPVVSKDDRFLRGVTGCCEVDKDAADVVVVVVVGIFVCHDNLALLLLFLRLRSWSKKWNMRRCL